MEPTNQSVDRAFDELEHGGNGHSPPSRRERIKNFVAPKLETTRDYFEEHRWLAPVLGFSLGFVLGRMLRRS